MLPAWVTTFGSGAAVALIGAVAGALFGFRRTKNEKALDRRIAWHEEAIQSLAQYEEKLERLDGHATHVLIFKDLKVPRLNPVPSKSSSKKLPDKVKAPALLWKDLGEAERRARAALRLADLYTDDRTQLQCNVALKSSVSIVSSQVIDISDEPEISWTDFKVKAFAVAQLRRHVQESLKRVLELEGFWANFLGARYRKWRKARRLKLLKIEFEESAKSLKEAINKDTKPGLG